MSEKDLLLAIKEEHERRMNTLARLPMLPMFAPKKGPRPIPAILGMTRGPTPDGKR